MHFLLVSIVAWGYQQERLQAGLYLFYAMLASLLILPIIFRIITDFID